MGLNRCQNCANYEVGYTMTMVGKTVFKRTHTKLYLPLRFSHGCFDSVMARRRKVLSALLYHKAHTLRSGASRRLPHFCRLGSFLLLRTFHPR